MHWRVGEIMNAKSKVIEGVSLFSVTPIAANGGIDLDRWKKHVDTAIAAGIHNLTMFGSTGGNGSFSEPEKMAALKAMAAHVAGRVPIMFGIGALITDESVRL